MKKIAIIDYGLGNIASIQNMLKKIGYSSVLTNKQSEILNSDLLILPGVGSYDHGIHNLIKYDLIDVLNESVLVLKKPVIGICLGMQLMCLKSEEGELKGLSWFDIEIKKFSFASTKFKVPHMGWNYVYSSQERVFHNIDEKRFYFTHSFYAEHDERYSLATCKYGDRIFDAAIVSDNVYGFQFHPEKSHKYGMRLLENILKNLL